MEKLRNDSAILRSKVQKHKAVVLKMLNLKDKTGAINYDSWLNTYLKAYVLKSLRREMLSIYFRQLISFNKSKFENRYLAPLTNLTKSILAKKVEFNIVNLKYLYLNSQIFTETLVTKLKNRKNRLLKVLKTSLLMFKLPSLDKTRRTALYNEIYNRKRKVQNLKLVSTGIEQHNLSSSQDPEDEPLSLTNTILDQIKHKYVSGIRIEAAGRLTRRNTAARSLFKLRYKGNIKNMDSSYKGLSTVLLRGHAKSNLQHTKSRSKLRIGSFGLKG